MFLLSNVRHAYNYTTCTTKENSTKPRRPRSSWPGSNGALERVGLMERNGLSLNISVIQKLVATADDLTLNLTTLRNRAGSRR